jgi:hypothetical protein
VDKERNQYEERGERGKRRKRTLNHRDPSLALVRNLRLTAKSHDLRVVHHARNHPRNRIGEDLGVGVNHEDNLVPIRRNARTAPQRVEEFVLERRHPLVEHGLLQEVHEDDLRVAFSTVSGFRLVLFLRVSDLGDEEHRNALLLRELDRVVVVFVETGVDLGHVVTFVTVGDGDVREGFDFGRRDDKLLHHAEDDFGSRERVTGSLDHAVGDDEDDLVRVGVVGRRKRVEGRAETFDGFGVRGDEEDRVGERVIERFVVGGSLGDDVAERERALSHRTTRSGGASETVEL